MSVTKIFRPEVNGCLPMAQVYENNYDSSLSKINRLAAELKNDFSGVTDEKIKTHKYAGVRQKGIPFVEVQLEKGTEAPEGYTVVSDIESIL
jgi:hypothetical protein